MGHAEHVACAAEVAFAGPKKPAAHWVPLQAVAPLPDAYVPGAHWVHAAAPVAPEAEPGGHETHCAEEVAPVAAR